MKPIIWGTVIGAGCRTEVQGYKIIEGGDASTELSLTDIEGI